LSETAAIIRQKPDAGIITSPMMNYTKVGVGVDKW
jgi:hypothetical protein